MSNAKTAAIVGAGLVGLYLLSGQGKDGDGGGGFGGGGGADRAPGDTIIDFPELDLSSLWGDVGDVFEAKKTPSDPGVDYFQYLKGIGELPTIGEEGDIMARSQFDISQYRTTTKKLMPTTPTPTAEPFNLSTWMKTHDIYGKRIPSKKDSSVPFRSSKDIRYPYDVSRARAPTVGGVKQYIPRGHK